MPTATSGLLGIRNFLNPFADKVSGRSLALALAGGLGLPLLAAIHGAQAAAWAGANLGVAPALARCAIEIAACFAGGFAVRSVFVNKTFLWSMLIGLAASWLLSASELPRIALALTMMAAAELGAWRRNRAERLV